jgi:hypothetical protein
MHWTFEEPGFSSQQKQHIFSSHVSKMSPGSTQPPIQWLFAQEYSSLGVKLTAHLHVMLVKKAWTHISTYTLMI